MLVEEVEAPAAQHYMPVEAHPGASQIQAFEAMLKEAQRPMFIIGGTRWSEEAVAGFQDFASRFKVPVGCSFRRQMLFDHLHPRSEEHTSELQSLMRISYAVFCLKNKKKYKTTITT